MLMFQVTENNEFILHSITKWWRNCDVIQDAVFTSELYPISAVPQSTFGTRFKTGLLPGYGYPDQSQLSCWRETPEFIAPQLWINQLPIDFLLVIHSNHGPFSYSFRDKKWYLQNYPTPLYLTPPLRGFHLEFCNGAGLKNQNDDPTRPWKEMWRHVHSFRHNTGTGLLGLETPGVVNIPEYRHWSDGRVCHNNTAFCMHCTLTDAW